MRAPTIAWFRPAPPALSPLDDTAALTAALAARFRVDDYDHARAHDFVWIHARQPYDLCVYELANTPAHAFVRPYLFHYPGVLRLRSLALDRLRPLGRPTTRLARERGVEQLAERAFSGPSLVRAPVLASRLVVVSDEHASAQLARAHPGAQVRHVPVGIDIPGASSPRDPDGRIRVGAPAGRSAAVLQRAAERALRHGSPVQLLPSGMSELQVLEEADVVVLLEWPPSTGEPPMAALAAMARGRLVVVLETEGTARWPALDPQSWRPRGPMASGQPVAISIDPRDEEHSLMLALRGLAADRTLVDRVAAAGHEWWRQHATFGHAVSGWQQALTDALDLTPPAHPDGWPAHLSSNGTGHAQRLLAGWQVSADFMR